MLRPISYRATADLIESTAVNLLSYLKQQPLQGTEGGVRSRTVGLMRLMLAATGLCIFALNPETGTTAYARNTYQLTLYFAYAYCVYATLLFALPAAMLRILRLAWLHWIDAAWYILLITPSGGLHSPFLPFFFFAILVASFRYGFAEGMRLTVASVLMLIVIHFFPLLPNAQHPLYPTLVHTASLLILGYLISRWGGWELVQKHQLQLLSEINRMPDPNANAEEVMGNALEHIRNFYGARSCIAVMRMPDTGYVIYKVDSDAAKPKMLGQPLDDGIAAHLLALPPQWSISYASNAKWYLSSSATYYPTESTSKTATQYGEVVTQLLEADSFASAPLYLHDQNIGRLYLTECKPQPDSADMAFLQQLISQITPYIDNIHLLDQIAAAATSSARQQISLDLHDGTIQPYIGLKLGLEALRRKIPDNDAIAAEIDELVRMTGDGIAELRQYVSGLRTRLEEPLMQALQHVANKYREHYAIQVTLDVDPKLKISDRLAAEIFQIVCEGLSNIHRHTNADRATVSLHEADQLIRVQIVNYGGTDQPLTFKPRSITERVAYLNGKVSVEQLEDGGTAVSAEIPSHAKEKHHAIHQ